MTPWAQATKALALLAIDPAGLGGLILRARCSPVREAALNVANQLPAPHIRLHPTQTPDDLGGGLDLAGTLERGALVQKPGLLSHASGTFFLVMAERADPQFAARLARKLDASSDTCLIALDEGASEDEVLPATLSDRLAFQVSLDGLSMHDVSNVAPLSKEAAINQVTCDDTLLHDLATIAMQLGISSLRAPSFALRAAKAHAALLGRNSVWFDDVEAAISLTLAHRATRLPEEETDTPEPEPETQDTSHRDNTLDLPDELLLEAVKAALPADLLARLNSGAAKRATGSGTGDKKTGNRRGRPLPARDARARSGARIDLMATLRAGIPWQTLRKKAQPDRIGAIIQPSDLRAKRYQEHSDRLLIFTVDASGSAALARLGEAKGAVELLLAEAYARRDHVALISFRGAEAEVLLHPTRSLVQTKRQLASLPGGGGTPLAAGLTAALNMADHATRKGLTPTVVLLTDGRSNIALDGSADRVQAATDARKMADALRRQGCDAVVIDTGNRPEQSLSELSKRLDGSYLALPRADAQKLSDAVSNHLGS